MKKKRVFSLLLVMVLATSMLTGCLKESANTTDRKATKKVSEELAANQPTPKDIEFSLERYNLIKRAYWVNGQKEKAMALECPVQRPLGYIILIDSGAVIGSYCVDGKVSSLNSYLTPDSEYYSTGSTTNNWLADVDGSYGANDNGIFFFTVDGHYQEWNGKYQYSDIPFHLNTPTITYQEVSE